MMDHMSLETATSRIGKSLSSVSTSIIASTNPNLPMIKRKTQALLKESFNLAEHHLYGSSRLGIKNYLAGQVQGYYMFRAGIGPIASIAYDTGTLVFRQPWYSGRLNELIRKNDKIDYAHFDTSRIRLAHVLGLKQYEVTNHLGNVLSTVSDNRYERGEFIYGGNGVTLGDSIKVFAPAVPTSYDYYPFGMLMPGRYMAADTTTEVVEVNIMATDRSPEAGGPISMAFATVPTGSTPTHSSFAVLPGGAISMTADTVGAGFDPDVPVDAGLNNTFELSATMLLGDPLRASVSEMVMGPGQVWSRREIASELLSIEGTYVMSFVPSGSSVRLSVLYNASGEAGTTAASAGSGGAGAGPAGTGGKGFSSITTSVKKGTDLEIGRYRTVKVVKNPKDLYRFGFDGMEKVNEIYGRGTHYDFGERYYSANVAKFFSIDKLEKKYPSISPYSFANNSPIMNIDNKGNEAEHYLHVITNKGVTVIRTVEKGAFLGRAHGDGMSEWTGYHNYRTDQTLDLRSGRKLSSINSRPVGGEVDFGDRMSEKWDAAFGSLQLPQVMVFGSGTDYNDWLKNPKADPRRKVYTFNMKELNEVYGLINVGLGISEPKFNATPGDKGLLADGGDKIIGLLNKTISDKIKKNDQSSTSGGGDKNNDDAYENDTICNGCGDKMKNGEMHGSDNVKIDQSVINRDGDTINTITK